jgi:L-ascorbate metabolism protein UlaG (beta-lactamase superfamily)
MGKTLSYDGIELKWLNHQAAFRLLKIAGSKVVYIDPWEVEPAGDADVILITHAHYDHLSPDDVEKLRAADTTIIGPQDCAAKLNGRAIAPGQSIPLGDMAIEAVPAYNLKPERQGFHPKKNNWVGYVVSIDNKRIYHAGDTDKIPEMAKIRCDIALLPVGGTYTMDGHEAAEAANVINPAIAVPMHWGRVVGSLKDVENFKKAAKAKVEVM